MPRAREVPLPRRRGVVICPEHHGPRVVCARRRHRQHSVRRAQLAQDARAAVEVAPPTPAAPPAPPAPPEPPYLAEPAVRRLGGYVAITPPALLDGLLVGQITARNLSQYSIVIGTTTTSAWPTGYTTGTGNTTWASSASTTGNWVTITYDEGGAVAAGRMADQIMDPYAEVHVEDDVATFRYERYAPLPGYAPRGYTPESYAPPPPETPEQRERREQRRRERQAELEIQQ